LKKIDNVNDNYELNKFFKKLTNINKELDYYSVLELPDGATFDEVKNQYKKLWLEYHPDKLKDKSEAEKKGTKEKTNAIEKAYLILGNEIKKAKYDLCLIEEDNHFLNEKKFQKLEAEKTEIDAEFTEKINLILENEPKSSGLT
jgi:curved DNA-binding protein CbpA